MELKVKKTVPPFENLMPYAAMRTIQCCERTSDVNSACKRQKDASSENSCYDNMKSHSGLISEITKRRCGTVATADGCYSARKVVIDRAESLATFLSEGASDSSDCCNSTDSDSLGDEGYSTDSHSRAANLSSSSSSLMSSDGEITPVTAKPGILKRSPDGNTFVCRKRVTFASLPDKRADGKLSGNDSSPVTRVPEKTLEQKIMALAIINEENEGESQSEFHREASPSRNSKSSSMVDKRDLRLRFSFGSDVNKDHLSRTNENRSRVQDQPKPDSYYVNIPETRQECMAYLRKSKLPHDRETTLPVCISNKRMSRNSVACPYIRDARQISRDDSDVSHTQSISTSCKQAVTRTLSSNSTPCGSNGSNFASSSDILRLFQNNPKSRTNPEEQRSRRKQSPSNLLSKTSSSKAVVSSNCNVYSKSSVLILPNTHTTNSPDVCVTANTPRSNISEICSKTDANLSEVHSQSKEPNLANNCLRYSKRNSYHAQTNTRETTPPTPQLSSRRARSNVKAPLSRQSSLPITPDSTRDRRLSDVLPYNTGDVNRAKAHFSKLSTLV